MEVVIVRADNVPDGCLLSLSAGGSRRQAQLVTKQKFAFSGSSAAAAAAPGGSGLKVDVLAVKGSHRIPAEKLIEGVASTFEGSGCRTIDLIIGSKNRNGDSDGGAPITLSLAVKPVVTGSDRPRTGSAMPTARAPAIAEEEPSALAVQAKEQTPMQMLKTPGLLESSLSANSKNFLQPQPSARSARGDTNEPKTSRRHHAALEARSYLEDHSILPFVEQVLRTLVQERPENPWKAIAHLLPAGTLSSMGIAIPQMPPSPRKPTTFETFKNKNIALIPSVATWTSRPSTPLKQQALADVETVELSMKIENIDLADLSADVELLESFTQTLKESVMASAGDGISGEHVEVVLTSGSIVASIKITPPPGTSAGNMQSKMASAPLADNLLTKLSALPGIDKIAKGPLTAAVEVKPLRSAAVDAFPEPAKPSVPPQVIEEQTPAAVAQIPANAWASIHAKFPEPAKPNAAMQVIEAPLSADARDSLVKAYKAGTLQAAIESEDVELLRKEAWESLSKANDDGSLASMGPRVEEVGRPTSGLESETLRVVAKEAIVEASKDGRLAVALQQLAKADADGVQEFAKAIAADISTSLADGRLEDAMLEAMGTSATTADAEVREIARETLRAASSDGRLLEALVTALAPPKSPRGELPVDDTEAMIGEARNVLVHASTDGRLAAALTVALSQVAGDEAGELRRAANDILLSSSADGRLEVALRRLLSSPTEVATMQRQARETLLKAHQEGRIQAMLSPGRSPRQQAMELLAEARSDGRLAEALRSVLMTPPNTAAELTQKENTQRQEAKKLLIQAVPAVIGTPLSSEAQLATDARDSLIKAFKAGTLQAAIESEDVELLRKEAWKSLTEANDDGSLAAAASALQPVADGEEPIMSDVKAIAREVLAAGAKDGRLAAALNVFLQTSGKEDEESMRNEARETLLQASGDGRLLSALKQIGGFAESSDLDQDHLRDLACQALLTASQDGTLVKALGSCVQPAQQEDVEALRQRTLETLLNASASGNLVSALEAVRDTSAEGDVEELRDQVRESLMEAVDSGRIFDALQDASIDLTDTECLRTVMREAFVRATADGRISEAIQQCVGLKELRSQAQQFLLQASVDGRLAEAVLANSDDEKFDASDARSIFLGAARDGRLTSALEQVFGRTADEDVECMRAQTRETFLQASADGHLASALRAETLRQQAQDILIGASNDGSLESALVASRQKDVDALRDQVEQILQGADFDIQAALRTAQSQQQEGADLRDQVQQILGNAANDGSLSNAVLRQQARNIVMSAAKDGSLLASLERLAQGVEEQNMSTSSGATRRPADMPSIAEDSMASDDFVAPLAPRSVVAGITALEFKFGNLNFDKVVSNSVVCTGLLSAVQDGVAERANIDPELVEVELMRGSVIVCATVRPANFDEAEKIRSSMENDVGALCDFLQARVMSVEGIKESMSGGPELGLELTKASVRCKLINTSSSFRQVRMGTASTAAPGEGDSGMAFTGFATTQPWQTAQRTSDDSWMSASPIKTVTPEKRTTVDDDFGPSPTFEPSLDDSMAVRATVTSLDAALAAVMDDEDPEVVADRNAVAAALTECALPPAKWLAPASVGTSAMESATAASDFCPPAPEAKQPSSSPGPAEQQQPREQKKAAVRPESAKFKPMEKITENDQVQADRKAVAANLMQDCMPSLFLDRPESAETTPMDSDESRGNSARILPSQLPVESEQFREQVQSALIQADENGSLQSALQIATAAASQASDPSRAGTIVADAIEQAASEIARSDVESVLSVGGKETILQEVAAIKCTFKDLDYDKMMKNEQLVGSCVLKVQEAIAFRVQVPAEAIEVQFQAQCVVQAVVKPFPGDRASDVKSRAETERTSLLSSMALLVRSIPGINAAMVKDSEDLGLGSSLEVSVFERVVVKGSSREASKVKTIQLQRPLRPASAEAKRVANDLLRDFVPKIALEQRAASFTGTSPMASAVSTVRGASKGGPPAPMLTEPSVVSSAMDSGVSSAMEQCNATFSVAQAELTSTIMASFEMHGTALESPEPLETFEMSTLDFHFADMDFDTVNGSPEMHEAFVLALRQSIADEMGVPIDEVELDLRPGSIYVTVSVRAPNHLGRSQSVAARDFSDMAKLRQAALMKAIATNVSNVPGILTASKSGSLGLSSLTVGTQLKQVPVKKAKAFVPSAAEIAQEAFKTADRNADGILDAEELKEAKQLLMTAASPVASVHSGSKAPSSVAKAPSIVAKSGSGGAPSVADKAQSASAESVAEKSVAEMTTHQQARDVALRSFEEMDVNKDGGVTVEEFVKVATEVADLAAHEQQKHAEQEAEDKRQHAYAAAEEARLRALAREEALQQAAQAASAFATETRPDSRESYRSITSDIIGRSVRDAEAMAEFDDASEVLADRASCADSNLADSKQGSKVASDPKQRTQFASTASFASGATSAVDALKREAEFQLVTAAVMNVVDPMIMQQKRDADAVSAVESKSDYEMIGSVAHSSAVAAEFADAAVKQAVCTFAPASENFSEAGASEAIMSVAMSSLAVRDQAGKAIGLALDACLLEQAQGSKPATVVSEGGVDAAVDAALPPPSMVSVENSLVEMGLGNVSAQATWAAIDGAARRYEYGAAPVATDSIAGTFVADPPLSLIRPQSEAQTSAMPSVLSRKGIEAAPAVHDAASIVSGTSAMPTLISCAPSVPADQLIGQMPPHGAAATRSLASSVMQTQITAHNYAAHIEPPIQGSKDVGSMVSIESENGERHQIANFTNQVVGRTAAEAQEHANAASEVLLYERSSAASDVLVAEGSVAAHSEPYSEAPFSDIVHREIVLETEGADASIVEEDQAPIVALKPIAELESSAMPASSVAKADEAALINLRSAAEAAVLPAPSTANVASSATGHVFEEAAFNVVAAAVVPAPSSAMAASSATGHVAEQAIINVVAVASAAVAPAPSTAIAASSVAGYVQIEKPRADFVGSVASGPIVETNIASEAGAGQGHVQLSFDYHRTVSVATDSIAGTFDVGSSIADSKQISPDLTKQLLAAEYGSSASGVFTVDSDMNYPAELAAQLTGTAVADAAEPHTWTEDAPVVESAPPAQAPVAAVSDLLSSPAISAAAWEAIYSKFPAPVKPASVATAAPTASAAPAAEQVLSPSISFSFSSLAITADAWAAIYAKFPAPLKPAPIADASAPPPVAQVTTGPKMALAIPASAWVSIYAKFPEPAKASAPPPVIEELRPVHAVEEQAPAKAAVAEAGAGPKMALAMPASAWVSIYAKFPEQAKAQEELPPPVPSAAYKEAALETVAKEGDALQAAECEEAAPPPLLSAAEKDAAQETVAKENDDLQAEKDQPPPLPSADDKEAALDKVANAEAELQSVSEKAQVQESASARMAVALKLPYTNYFDAHIRSVPAEAFRTMYVPFREKAPAPTPATAAVPAVAPVAALAPADLRNMPTEAWQSAYLRFRVRDEPPVAASASNAAAAEAAATEAIDDPLAGGPSVSSVNYSVSTEQMETSPTGTAALPETERFEQECQGVFSLNEQLRDENDRLRQELNMLLALATPSVTPTDTPQHTNREGAPPAE